MFKKTPGFSIIEAIISLVLLGIGMAALLAMTTSGRFFLKQSENKSYAMNKAWSQMQKYLAMSYTKLSEQNSYQESFSGPPVPVQLSADIKRDYAGILPHRIPYQRIEVTSSYNEEQSGARVEKKTVRLENIVPYPYLHTDSICIDSNKPDICKPLNVADLVAYSANPIDMLPLYRVGGLNNPLFTRNIKYEVMKNLMLVYNINIDILSGLTLEDTNTIYTQCYFDGISEGLLTRTPITTQPSINNVLVIKNVAPVLGGHSIEIRWCKDTQKGAIALKNAELTVIATETQ